MTIPITSVTIGGTVLSLTDVDYSVNVTHGRNDIKSQPEASTAVITIYGSSGIAVKIGSVVEIQSYASKRFVGEVSDLAITHVPSTPAMAITTITSIGNLSNLGSRLTGAAGYAAQTVYDRVGQVLTDSGETTLNGATRNLNLFATAADSVTCLDELQTLAETSGATYFDTPRGYVVFESYGQRGITTFPGAWIFNIQTWSDYAQTWDSFPTDRSATSLPSSGVVYTPTWNQNQVSIANDVSVSYGNPVATTQQTDLTSIVTYGRKALSLSTGLDAVADATKRASDILLAQAYPLWNLGNISIFVDQLSPTDRAAVLNLVSGSSIIVNGLPRPAPYSQFLGIVEGWSETYTPGQHLITLSISDPRYSYQTVTWAGVDASLTWAGVDAALIWYNAVTAQDLAA